MESNYAQILKKIQKELKKCAISCSLENIPNVEDVSIIINSYSPEDNLKPVSIAFSIKTDLSSFNPKCWITQKKVSTISFNRNYIEFEFNNKKFYPFSVNLTDNNLHPINADYIKKLCEKLYKYIDFQNCGRK